MTFSTGHLGTIKAPGQSEFNESRNVMPLYGSKGFHPFTSGNHLQAAIAFATAKCKEGTSDLTPGHFTTIERDSRVHKFHYTLSDPMGAIVGYETISVVHYASVMD